MSSARRTADRPRRRASAPRAVTVEARAKLNLGLAVGPVRADGFHELATIFQSVSLSDTLVVRRGGKSFRLRVRFEDPRLVAPTRGRRSTVAPGKRSSVARSLPGRWVPVGTENLVLEAARLFASETGISEGAEFELTKRIPARAGLGGGSADAAAALSGLLRVHGVRLPLERRIELGARLGSDVPFALFGGTALGRGRGERLRRLALSAPFRAVVAVPRWRVSTREAFARIDRRKYGLTSWPLKLRLANALERFNVQAPRSLLIGNTFEKALGNRQREFEQLRACLLRAGASVARLTGSGSAVFGILPPGVSAREVAGRFTGSEALYEVRSARSGLRLRPQP